MQVTNLQYLSLWLMICCNCLPSYLSQEQRSELPFFCQIATYLFKGAKFIFNTRFSTLPRTITTIYSLMSF